MLDFAGVDLTQRDPVDTNIVTNVRYQTGRIISVPPVTPSGLVDLWKGENNANDSINTNNDGTTPMAWVTPPLVQSAMPFNLTVSQICFGD